MRFNDVSRKLLDGVKSMYVNGLVYVRAKEVRVFRLKLMSVVV